MNVPSDCLAEMIKVENDLALVAAPKVKIWKMNCATHSKKKKSNARGISRTLNVQKKILRTKARATTRLLAGLVEQENLAHFLGPP